MTAEQEGGFFRLCMFQWKEGSLPDHDPTLMRMARLSGTAADHGLVLDAFVVGADGRRRCDKVSGVRKDTEDYLDGQSKAGLKGNAVRWGSRPDRDPIAKGSLPSSELRALETHPSDEKNKRARKRAVVVDPITVISEFHEFDTPEVRTAANAYLEARRPKHGTWTGQGMRIALRKFKGMTPSDVVLAFETATEGPWQTIWPVDAATAGRRNGHIQDDTANVRQQLEQLKLVSENPDKFNPFMRLNA